MLYIPWNYCGQKKMNSNLLIYKTTWREPIEKIHQATYLGMVHMSGPLTVYTAEMTIVIRAQSVPRSVARRGLVDRLRIPDV